MTGSCMSDYFASDFISIRTFLFCIIELVIIILLSAGKPIN